ncbi:NADPH:quinone oxidoreductase family protein [Hansschlegelia zhihuaiae]|uniref:NADPH:quinone oxidoreductase family protein n=1 Tax=Hansschlegelia zhihuaiae TaxID=405005 RepID=A0A4Q0M7H1_9HYPH|nr:NADPH:quinone oxidoreductase family protein [Hansschlegelia zhihuaiae]RXF68729.1 NADPH:quinone oxidoreductase family protein [Hansschlegelia zhihuaiae]
MKAVLCVELGGPEALRLEDLPDPEPGPDEVAVDVAFAALNFFDTLIIAGKYQSKPALPFSPGGEMSGVVSAVGARVEGLAVGDRVAGYLGHGCCREKIVARPDQLTLVPEELGLDRAAGLIITYGTTLHALADRGELKGGETLAVLGASGGVGIAAVEVGRLLGARVIACASSAEKLAFAKERGADELVDYSREDLKTRLKELTDGRGVDVVYDPVGGDFAEAAVRALAWRGRHLVIGFAAGEIPKLPLNLPMLKGADVRGVFWSAHAEREPAAHRAELARLFDWAADGEISAHVDAILPLAETAEAIARIKRREAKGKILVRP